jgi:hypothetical protein
MRRLLKLQSIAALALALGAAVPGAEAAAAGLQGAGTGVKQSSQRATMQQRVPIIGPHIRVPQPIQLTRTATSPRAVVGQRPGSIRLHQHRYPLR